jgi:hypothetical protein
VFHLYPIPNSLSEKPAQKLQRLSSHFFCRPMTFMNYCFCFTSRGQIRLGAFSLDQLNLDNWIHGNSTVSGTVPSTSEDFRIRINPILQIYTLLTIPLYVTAKHINTIIFSHEPHCIHSALPTKILWLAFTKSKFFSVLKALYVTHQICAVRKNETNLNCQT